MDRTPRDMSRPQTGTWATRMTKGGPIVAAAIRVIQTTHLPDDPSVLLERGPFLQAFLDGEEVPLSSVWLRRLEPITEAEYEYRLRVSRWAREHKPDAPEANPQQKVDIGAMPPLYRRQPK